MAEQRGPAGTAVAMAAAAAALPFLLLVWEIQAEHGRWSGDLDVTLRSSKEMRGGMTTAPSQPDAW